MTFLSLFGACTSAPTRAALSGDLTSLKSAVAQAEQAGQLAPSRVRDVAEAVLARELVSLGGPTEQFPDLTPCSRQVRPALEQLAESESEFAAPAALALIDAGVSPPASEAPVARLVVQARQSEGAAHGVARRDYMLSGDADVRRAALGAAAMSADARDESALLEAARLDPDPEARELAVRALGAIGGEAIVLGLVDVWQAASEELRREILAVWASPACSSHGGEEQLVNVAEQAASELAVAAALELEWRGAGPAGVSTQVLLRVLRGGDSPARRLALLEAPWQNSELRAAITLHAKADDAATQLLSSLRLAEHGVLDAESAARLAKLAEAGTPAQAVLARAVLARAGIASARPGLRADLAAPRANQRVLAALALISLDDWPGAAHALGDDSPEVRRAVACHMLADAAEERETAAERAFGPLAPELLAMLVDAGVRAPDVAAKKPPASPKPRPRVEPKPRQ